MKAVMVDYAGKISFVDTKAAARYLALSPHSLECFRSLGGGPPFKSWGTSCATKWRTLERGLPASGTTGPAGQTLGSINQTAEPNRTGLRQKYVRTSCLIFGHGLYTASD